MTDTIQPSSDDALAREREDDLLTRIRNAANWLVCPDTNRQEQKYAMRALDDAEREIESQAREIAALTDALAQAQQENVCDACLGIGKPISGKPCMCGGTGKMSDAARYLREQSVQTRREIAALTVRVEAAERNERRYLWLQAHDMRLPERALAHACHHALTDREVDGYIDAALAEQERAAKGSK